MGFSEEQEALVKDSWKIVRHNISDLSLYFFNQVLEMEPSAKGLFSFLRDTDEIPKDNPKVKSHAYIVFKMTCDAAIHLREKREVVVSDFALKHLGYVHLQKGIVDPHFEVVKKAVLRTVEKGVGDEWSEEMKGAWTEAYDQLAAAIQNEMKKEAAEIDKMKKEAAINS